MRNKKHDTSSAYTHAYDVRELLNSKLIERFPKTFITEVDLFQMLNLGVLIHGVNAAGLLVFNPVEHRMPYSCHDLTDIILLYRSFGDRLDSFKERFMRIWTKEN